MGNVTAIKKPAEDDETEFGDGDDGGEMDLCCDYCGGESYVAVVWFKAPMMVCSTCCWPSEKITFALIGESVH